MTEIPSGGAALYLDLIKRCLTDSIYTSDPLANFVPYRPKPQMSAGKRVAVSVLQRMLHRYRLRLVEPYAIPWINDFSALSPEEMTRIRETGSAWPARAHTMIGLRRLDRLQSCVETTIHEDIPGDLIETGVWRGGACILMRAVLKAHHDTARTVWVADSFAGLPPPDSGAYPADTGDLHHTLADFLAISREQVADNFDRYGLLDRQVKFLKGWFKDTLPTAPIEKLAVIRMDGDMYESTIQVLETLYDKLSPGGFVIVDDYDLKPCAEAVHDFRNARGITDTIDLSGGSAGAFWRKSG
jgi:O-methyltransferase